MAERGDLAVTPGQLYIEVEYDYEYKSKDRIITIKQGECFLLVKKTNADWWQVRREEGSKPFYVPAQYVREVRRALMPPAKPLLHTGGGAGVKEGSEKKVLPALELKQFDESLNKQSPDKSPCAGYPAALQAPKEDKVIPKSPRSQGQQIFLNLQLHTSPPRILPEPFFRFRAPLNVDEESENRREEATADDEEREKKKGGGNRRREEEWIGDGERGKDEGWDRDAEGERKKEGEIGEDKLKEQKREERCDRDGEKVRDGVKEKKDERRQHKTAAPKESSREATEENQNDFKSGDELNRSSTEQLQVGGTIKTF